MIRVNDIITGDELYYEDIEDFRNTIKHSYDESVHDAVDQLADTLIIGGYTGELEAFLGIEIQEA